MDHNTNPKNPNEFSIISNFGDIRDVAFILEWIFTYLIFLSLLFYKIIVEHMFYGFNSNFVCE